MTPEQITAWTKFLEYGPIGFAALMLVLVIVALAMGNFTPARERTIKLFLVIGAICFFIAILAGIIQRPQEYTVHLEIIPLGSASSILHEPSIKMNGKEIKGGDVIIDKGDLTVLVDVTQAIAVTAQLKSESEQQKRALSEISLNIQSAIDLTESISSRGLTSSELRSDVTILESTLNETQDAVSQGLSATR